MPRSCHDHRPPQRRAHRPRHRDRCGANRLAISATTHCLVGCGIGEILGLAIATALGWGDLVSIALAVVLAFVFGYALTLRPLLKGGIAFGAAAGLAFAADTLSITVMEIVDNAILLLIPGAMDAGLPTYCSGPAWPSRWGSPGSSPSR